MCLVSYKRKIDDISIRHYNSIGLNKILQWCNHIVEGNIRKPNIASTNSDSVNITPMCRIPSESFVQPHELSPTSSCQDLFMGTKAEFCHFHSGFDVDFSIGFCIFLISLQYSVSNCLNLTSFTTRTDLCQSQN